MNTYEQIYVMTIPQIIENIASGFRLQATSFVFDSIKKILYNDAT